MQGLNLVEIASPQEHNRKSHIALLIVPPPRTAHLYWNESSAVSDVKRKLHVCGYLSSLRNTPQPANGAVCRIKQLLHTHTPALSLKFAGVWSSCVLCFRKGFRVHICWKGCVLSGANHTFFTMQFFHRGLMSVNSEFFMTFQDLLFLCFTTGSRVHWFRTSFCSEMN